MKVSNADRVIFPEDGITKGDVVAYYEQVAESMLPHLEGRPLTLQRFPRGIAQAGFMQKNAPDHFPDSIERIDVPKREDGTTRYPVLRVAGDIPYLANQGTVTFHAWASRLPELERPDRIVVDLDPPGGDVEEVRQAAALVHRVLDEIGLPTSPVATGSKGFHLVAPVVAGDDSRHLAHLMHAAAIWIAGHDEELLTTEFRIDDRKGRVFIDWLRNRPGQTAVVPWSLRPRAGAPVAVPLTWDAMDDALPDGLRMDGVEEALARPDPLLEMASRPTDPAPALDALRAVMDEAGIEPEPFDRFRP